MDKDAALHHDHSWITDTAFYATKDVQFSIKLFKLRIYYRNTPTRFEIFEVLIYYY